jgi:hypothetical protein
MRDAELHASEDVCAPGATSEIGVIGAVGANELQRQVVEAGAGREVRGETIETIL